MVIIPIQMRGVEEQGAKRERATEEVMVDELMISPNREGMM